LVPIVTSACASVMEAFGTMGAPAKAGTAAKHSAAENTKVRDFIFNLLVVQ
jgi:hypothetical protein